MLVEIGDNMDAFGSVDRLASWAGICPGNNESAGKRKSGRTGKGNPWVRRLLSQSVVKKRSEELLGEVGQGDGDQDAHHPGKLVELGVHQRSLRELSFATPDDER
jgi:hypothetical protein